MKKLYRGSYIDAFCQVWFHLVQLFQRSRLKYEKLTDGRQVMAIPHMTLWVRWAKNHVHFTSKCMLYSLCQLYSTRVRFPCLALLLVLRFYRSIQKKSSKIRKKFLACCASFFLVRSRLFATFSLFLWKKQLFLAHLAKASFWHHLASVNFSHFNLLLWNPSAKWTETW
jgi:hypothetical protein